MFKIIIDHTDSGPKMEDRYRMIADVLEDFSSRGHILTIRQVFYQLVAQGKLENTPKNYGNIIRWGTEARERGFVDWDALEDRIRKIVLPNFFDDLTNGLQSLQAGYRRDRQEGQKFHYEVWAEKDAVTEILEPIAREYGMPYQCGHGQFSLPCFRAAMLRFEADPRPVRILYFGDHDPSGIFSIEGNIRIKFAQLMPKKHVQVYRVAMPLLCSEDADAYKKLLPCPLKEKDVNTKKYRALYGDKSWELEALSLEVLQRLLQVTLDQHIDSKYYLKVLDREKEDIKKLKKLIAK